MLSLSTRSLRIENEWTPVRVIEPGWRDRTVSGQVRSPRLPSPVLAMCLGDVPLGEPHLVQSRDSLVKQRVTACHTNREIVSSVCRESKLKVSELFSVRISAYFRGQSSKSVESTKVEKRTTGLRYGRNCTHATAGA